jgi:hypothetical protein
MPGQSTNGLVAVSVPQNTAVSGSGLVIPLPDHVTAPVEAQANSALSVTLSNNQPLPAWIKFDSSSKALVTTAVPGGSFPISVAVSIGGVRTIIQVSESQNK